MPPMNIIFNGGHQHHREPTFVQVADQAKFRCGFVEEVTIGIPKVEGINIAEAVVTHHHGFGRGVLLPTPLKPNFQFAVQLVGHTIQHKSINQ